MSIKDNLFFKRMKKLSDRTHEQLTSDKPTRNIFAGGLYEGDKSPSVLLVSSKTFTALQQDGVIADEKCEVRGKSENECEPHNTSVKRHGARHKAHGKQHTKHATPI